MQRSMSVLDILSAVFRVLGGLRFFKHYAGQNHLVMCVVNEGAIGLSRYQSLISVDINR